MNDITKAVEAAYLHDQAHNAHPVTHRDELPIAFEWITKEWLTDILCADAPGAEVTDFVLGAVDNGSSNRRRIALRYNEAGEAAAALPSSIFCKAAFDLPNRVILGIAQGAECESNFYDKVRARLDIEAPQAYYVKLDTETWKSMIVLNDITDSVTEFCNHKTIMTRARAESQLRLLARMHGKCYSDPELIKITTDNFLTWPEYFGRTLLFGMREGSEAGFQKARDVLPARLSARGAEIWSATMKSIAFHDRAPKTFVHHDVHLKNWYVAGDGEMGLSDWQCAVRGHWSRDVCYALATALTIEDRRMWERELLRYYLDHLHMEGGPKLGFDEAWLHYRQQLVTALTWWTITINPAEGMPDMQPMDVTLEFLRRIGTAMDDLDTLDTFRGDAD